MSNFYDDYDWNTMWILHPAKGDEREKQDELKRRYFSILSSDFPSFLEPYLRLPLLERLKGIGLMCGTDWTPLYHNRFSYSRYDHSLGVALIVWHFTHDKAQTIAGLLHDVSTPVFSHVADFRKGDPLRQEATEEENSSLVMTDTALAALLAADGLVPSQVADYHAYPVADNEIPQLSADRLEYMFPSGLVLDGSWTFEDIERDYGDIDVLVNEDGAPELGFRTVEIAEDYCRHFCLIGHILQLNENKLCLQLLAEVVKEAIALGLLTEAETMTLSEADVMGRFDQAARRLSAELGGPGSSAAPAAARQPAAAPGAREPAAARQPAASTAAASQPAAASAAREPGAPDTPEAHARRFVQLYRTFRTMTGIEHTQAPLPDHFCISMKVKQRYINPLVQPEGAEKAVRLTAVSQFAEQLVNDFLSFEDTLYGCVPLAGLTAAGEAQ